MRSKRQLKNSLQSSVISFIVLNICNVINSWVHYYTYVYRGYYAVARRYEFYVRVARTMSLTREILFLSREHKIHIFEPTCNVLFIIFSLNIEYFRFYCAIFPILWCQVYRNTKPNHAKFCELILKKKKKKITDFDLNHQIQ